MVFLGAWAVHPWWNMKGFYYKDSGHEDDMALATVSRVNQL